MAGVSKIPAPITIPTIMATASKKARASFGEATSLAFKARLSELLFTCLLTINTLAKLN
jgi:hypothetical protein